MDVKWTVGVVTTPRQSEYYLNDTLESIKNSGWDCINLFAEPDSKIPSNFDDNLVKRSKKYGNWTNWVCGLFELFMNNPNSDYFIMFEDDIVLCHNIKPYLEYCLPELVPFASISLYTPSYYCVPKRCFHNECRGWNTYCTQTVVMSKKSVNKFLTNYNVIAHRTGETACPKTADITSKTWPEYKNTCKDGIIGRWAKEENLPIYYHSPSLVEHIGEDSSLKDQPAKIFSQHHTSKDFVGEDFNASNWIGKPIKVHKKSLINLGF